MTTMTALQMMEAHGRREMAPSGSLAAAAGTSTRSAAGQPIAASSALAKAAGTSAFAFCGNCDYVRLITLPPLAEISKAALVFYCIFFLYI